ncbi:hypothetical protein HPB47_016480 [Ixodes persulcatus]|uniref:Uncharacterized protein n=1 Tax=Ixodes persulcatus TaxID=34615 RepID=A0AC60R071_IXOPE|nr:hypothetical protein HPB47_016480 [Ixodes persulcatus]
MWRKGPETCPVRMAVYGTLTLRVPKPRVLPNRPRTLPRPLFLNILPGRHWCRCCLKKEEPLDRPVDLSPRMLSSGPSSLKKSSCPDSSHGLSRSSFLTRDEKQWLWKQLALNALGSPTKSSEQWKEHWSRRVMNPRKRAAQLNEAARRTGGGSSAVRPLASSLARILTLVGADSALGAPGVRVSGEWDDQQLLEVLERISGNLDRTVSGIENNHSTLVQLLLLLARRALEQPAVPGPPAAPVPTAAAPTAAPAYPAATAPTAPQPTPQPWPQPPPRPPCS